MECEGRLVHRQGGEAVDKERFLELEQALFQRGSGLGAAPHPAQIQLHERIKDPSRQAVRHILHCREVAQRPDKRLVHLQPRSRTEPGDERDGCLHGRRPRGLPLSERLGVYL